MARVYSAEGAVAITDTSDIFELLPGSGAAVQILSIHLGQTSDAGDAEAEMAAVELHRFTTSGSGGTAATEYPHEVGNTATAAVEFGNTTDATTLTGPVISEAFNVQAGWFYNPIPEERITLSPGGDGIVCKLAANPADSLSMQFRITWAEIG